MAARHTPALNQTPSNFRRLVSYGAVPAAGPTFQAFQYAISNNCRAYTTRSDYYVPIGQVEINGTLRSRMVDKQSIRIIDALNAQANTCTFECFDFAPLRGQEVIISLGTTQNRLFGGYILSVDQTTPNVNQRVRYTVSCVDYTWLLESRRITGKRYVGESVTNIVRDLILNFAPPGFTTHNVEASMPAVDFTANHAETMMQALSRLMKTVGGYCYIDYRKDVHAFVNPEADSNPLVIGTSTYTRFWDFQYHVDLSQVRTRTYVLGGTTQTTSTVPNTATEIPVVDTSRFSETGGEALSYGNQLLYSGTSPSTGPGWLTGVTSFAYAIPQGESVRVMATRVNSNAAASIATILGTGDGLIDHVIDDERLSDSGARDRGDGDLAIFAEPDAGVTLFSRDKSMRSGKTLPVSLSVPSDISAEFVVQEVEITGIGIGSNPKFPLRRAQASKAYRDAFQILSAADRMSTEGNA